jgi:hypothetical protein
VHFAGFDTHQGLALLQRYAASEYRAWRGDDADGHLASAERQPVDGVLLQDEQGRPALVSAEEFAEALRPSPGSPPVSLLCFNVYNSGPRVAALSVAIGRVRAAVGFQDEVDDEMSEEFFASFYGRWRAGADAHSAVRDSWELMRAHPARLQGTGLVLWTDYAPPTPPAGTQLADGPARRGGTHAQPSPVRRRLTGPESGKNASDYLEVEVSPLEDVNYSLLHNRRSLFRTFRLKKLRPEVILEGVTVTVELHAGGDTFPCKTRVDLIDRSVSLTDEVHVPLTSKLSRSLRERVRTSLFVEVSWGERGVVYRRTHSVILLPIDEWLDDDHSRSLLPSFVLPTEPAVKRVVAAARKYLQALADDVSAGFDGYQGDNAPGAAYRGERVDQQVRAIWTALSSDFDLSYINPPPTYALQSQRLRTPSEVLEATHGTCLDLALLLAACLEYVDIYPVLVLLRGHAFPGYWRTLEAHERFRRVRVPPRHRDPDAASVERIGAAALQSEAWHLQRDRFDEVGGFIDGSDLVPLETVELTSRSGFWHAVAEGERNLRSRGEFDSLLDVKLARDARVTPLPIQVVTVT